MTSQLRTTPKISVQIWRPLIVRLDQKMTQACLRRDAYLAKVLEVEIAYLDSEVGIPNSPDSFDFVTQKLDLLDRKLVSLALPHDLTARLNDVCARKLIVRDAFFNRLYLLLAASPRVIDRLLFDGFEDDWRRLVWSENKHDGPFFQNGFYPLEPDIDPFWALRNGLDYYSRELGLERYLEPTTGQDVMVSRGVAGELEPAPSVYSTVFNLKVSGNDLLGLSCHIPDHLIPGHPAEAAHRAGLDELFSTLEVT